jgi:cyclic pyranopterin phosphate synthase
VSVDSLDEATFARITGRRDRLGRVRAGVEAALAAGLRVKVNVVLLRDLNAGELDDFVEWARRTPIVVRFIELMRTGENRVFYLRHHAPMAALRARLVADGWRPRPRRADDGPAEELVHPDYMGGVGLIAPLDPRFCDQCNRLRVTSRGDLRLCLFGDRDFPLRPLIADGARAAELAATVRALVARKPPAHRLREDDPGSMQRLAMVGG